MAQQSGGAFLPGDPVTFSNTVTMSGPVVMSGAVSTTGTVTNTVNPLITNNVGTASTSVTAVEYGVGPFHQTVLTISSLAMAISDLHFGGGSKLYTFPEGNIMVLGATCTVQETTTSTIASTLKASKTLSVGVGSVQTTTQDSGTLVTTQQDIVNAFACTSSATINVAGTAVNGKQSATTALKFDGTSTAQPIWLNCGVVTNTDIDADATTTWSGTVTLTWVWNGDY